MLSRVANSLYWMARYIERAENIARIVDVNLQLLLDLRNLDEKRLAAYWLPIVQATGDEEQFSNCTRTPPARPSRNFWCSRWKIRTRSLQSICQARENARMVRDQITLELWEELNRLYLFVRSPQARKVWRRQPERIFSGNQGQFAASHRHHERHADPQRRLVVCAGRPISRTRGQDHAHPGRALRNPARKRRCRERSAETDALEWSAVLRSCSAWDAYKTIHGADVHPRLVAEFLLLNDGFSALRPLLRGRTESRAPPHFRRGRGQFLQRRRKTDRPFSRRTAIQHHRRNFRRRPARLSGRGADETQRHRRRAVPRLYFPAFQNPDEEHMVQQEEQQQQNGLSLITSVNRH